jgi:hypothetical protein
MSSLESRLDRLAARLEPEEPPPAIHGPWCPDDCDHTGMRTFTLKLSGPQDWPHEKDDGDN